MRVFTNENGSVRGFLILAILVFVSYEGLMLGRNYFDNLRLEERVDAVAMESFKKIKATNPAERISLRDGPELASAAIMDGAKLMGIPLDRDAVKISIYTKPGDSESEKIIYYDADLRWSRPFTVLGLIKKDLQYVVKLQRSVEYKN